MGLAMMVCHAATLSGLTEVELRHGSISPLAPEQLIRVEPRVEPIRQR